MTGTGDSVNNGRWRTALRGDGARSVDERLVELCESVCTLFEFADSWASDPTNFDPIVVLVSRRLSCLYEMLTGPDLGMTELPCEVVYDRALDENPWWVGRSVLILDDALVFGSTLADRYDKVVSLVQDRDGITVRVACIDEERRSTLLVKRLGLLRHGPVPRRSLKEIEDFARHLATCLYRNGMPYFTDFPLTAPLEIGRSALSKLTRTRQWSVFDVTSKLLAAPGQLAYSFVPTDKTVLRIRARGHQQVTQTATLMKVRLWATPKDKRAYRVRIVPIGVPGPMMEPTLERTLVTLEDWIHRDGDSTSLEWDKWKLTAKHRLLQMYLSTCVLSEFWDELRNVLGDSLDDLGESQLEQSHVEGYFSKPHHESIKTAFNVSVRLARDHTSNTTTVSERFLPIPVDGHLFDERFVRLHLNTTAVTGEPVTNGRNELRDLALVFHTPERPQPGKVKVVDQIWAQRVLDIFGVVDRSLEKRQQRDLQEFLDEGIDIDDDLNWTSEDEQRYASRYVQYRDGKLNRFGSRYIRRGLTLDAIAQTVLDDAGEWARIAISLAIDIGNDLGTAVPTTECQDGAQVPMRGPIYRHYRSGENAHLTATPIFELVGREPDAALRAMDEQTLAALEVTSRTWSKLSRAERKQMMRFLDANEACYLRTLGPPGTRLVQRREGTIVEVDDETGEFVATVISRIDGQSDLAKLSLGDLEGVKDPQSMVGAEFDWRMTMQPGADTPQSRILLLRR